MYYQIYIKTIDGRWVYLAEYDIYEDAERRLENFITNFSGEMAWIDPDTEERKLAEAEIRKVTTVLKRTGW